MNGQPLMLSAQIHETAIIDPQVRISLPPSVVVGPYAVIEHSVKISPHCEIQAGAFIERNSFLPTGTKVRPNTVYTEEINLGEWRVISANATRYRFNIEGMKKNMDQLEMEAFIRTEANK